MRRKVWLDLLDFRKEIIDIIRSSIPDTDDLDGVLLDSVNGDMVGNDQVPQIRFLSYFQGQIQP